LDAIRPVERLRAFYDGYTRADGGRSVATRFAIEDAIKANRRGHGEAAAAPRRTAQKPLHQRRSPSARSSYAVDSDREETGQRAAGAVTGDLVPLGRTHVHDPAELAQGRMRGFGAGVPMERSVRASLAFRWPPAFKAEDRAPARSPRANAYSAIPHRDERETGDALQNEYGERDKTDSGSFAGVR
jgi:hypothetical protein